MRHRLYPMFLLVAHRGLRLGEACGARWPGRRPGGLMFTEPDGIALRPSDVTDIFQFRAAQAQAGLPPIGLHDLCHGAATLALAAGVDMKVVWEMLRHASITVTSDTCTTVLSEAPSLPPRRRP